MLFILPCLPSWKVSDPSEPGLLSNPGLPRLPREDNFGSVKPAPFSYYKSFELTFVCFLLGAKVFYSELSGFLGPT
jgi:hypothetical protein